VTGGTLIPDSLRSAACEAVVRALGYLRSRQCANGGFCFYRVEDLEEPNLHDTYHAVCALRSAGVEVPRLEPLLRFLDDSELYGPDYLFYYAFTLEAMGRAGRIDSRRREAIDALHLDAPRPGAEIVLGGWLQTALRIVRLKRAFTVARPLPGVARFVETLKRDGGYGEKPNLRDTLLCLRILEVLGHAPQVEDTRRFVRGLQCRHTGFTLTGDSTLADLDTLRAGLRCCEMLDLAVQHAPDILAFTLRCQGGNGGFSRVPGALPDIEQTHRALQVVAILDSPLLRSPNADPL
jgi:hypothetical protein